MSDLQRFTLYGENKKGTQHKYYEVEAEELDGGCAQWTFRWARIGYRCPKPKTGTTYNFESAKRICEAQFEKKRGRGYREVSPLEALASAGQDVNDRADVNGLSKVTLDFPNFHAGRSESRMQQFCEKYNTKLNVIRASFHDMEWSKYRKQIEDMLKAYCAEFKRIKGSKAHGPLLESFADTAMSIFFRALRDDAGCSVYGYFEGVGVY